MRRLPGCRRVRMKATPRRLDNWSAEQLVFASHWLQQKLRTSLLICWGHRTRRLPANGNPGTAAGEASDGVARERSNQYQAAVACCWSVLARLLPARSCTSACVFELDFEAGLLCKNGQQVKLQGRGK